MNRHTLSRSPEHVRFAASTAEGPIPDYRPELGPCLLWIGSLKPNGYGQMRWHGSQGYSHRYAWTAARGPIPEGMTVDHLCRVRNCVRVEHMELCGAVENYLRGAAARTTCRFGHEKTPDNVQIDSRGNRRCLICLRANQRRSSEVQSARRGPALGYAGERNAAAVLTWESVRALRQADEAGATVRDLMRQFGISQSQTRRIIRGESWRDDR